MSGYYDDNYGHWDMDEPEMEEFYWQTQKTNVEKVCQGCGQTVFIQPHYAYCNSCCERLESGMDLGGY